MKNSHTQIGFSLLVGFLTLLSLPTQADEIKTKLICEKIKTCVLESLGEQEMPAQMKDLIVTQLDTQCGQIHTNNDDQIKEAGLTDQANACADELIAMPCPQLMTPNVAENSKACVALKEAAEEAGIETN